MEFDKAKITDYRLEMSFIADQIEKHFQSIKCVHSDDNADKLVMRIRTIDTGREVGDKDIDEDMELRLLQEVENVMLTEVPLQGIPGITKVFLSKQQRYNLDPVGPRAWEGQIEWALETEGSSLAAVLRHPEVDPTRTFCNDVVEILVRFSLSLLACCLMCRVYWALRHVGKLFSTSFSLLSLSTVPTSTIVTLPPSLIS